MPNGLWSMMKAPSGELQSRLISKVKKMNANDEVTENEGPFNIKERCRLSPQGAKSFTRLITNSMQLEVTKSDGSKMKLTDANVEEALRKLTGVITGRATDAKLYRYMWLAWSFWECQKVSDQGDPVFAEARKEMRHDRRHYVIAWSASPGSRFPDAGNAFTVPRCR